MNRRLVAVLGFVCVLFPGGLFGAGPEPLRLFVKEVPLKLLGKEVTVMAIEQPGEVIAQEWDDQKQALVRAVVRRPATVLKYDGADIKFWQPEKQASELQYQAESQTPSGS
jgi:hypothetical protein